MITGANQIKQDGQAKAPDRTGPDWNRLTEKRTVPDRARFWFSRDQTGPEQLAMFGVRSRCTIVTGPVGILVNFKASSRLHLTDLTGEINTADRLNKSKHGTGPIRAITRPDRTNKPHYQTRPDQQTKTPRRNKQDETFCKLC